MPRHHKNYKKVLLSGRAFFYACQKEIGVVKSIPKYQSDEKI